MRILEEGEVDSYLEWFIEKEFVWVMEEAGWITVKGDKIKRGFPDRFLFGPKETVLIVEFKRTGAPKKRRGEKLQNHYRAEFERLGFRTLKCVGWNEACELLKELMEN